MIYDVVIVGSGISGIGAGYYLKRDIPGIKLLILDDQSSIGGTWNRFTYPGVRTDSELSLYSYDFKQIKTHNKSYAIGAEIQTYLEEVALESDLNIKLNYTVVSASWSNNMWELLVRNNDQEVLVKTKFLFMCNGYYDHNKGYIPDWPGISNYQGSIIHTQSWDHNLNYTGKNITIIGSGTSAISLIPELALKANHITMLQRSAGYYSIGRKEFNGIVGTELKSAIINNYKIFLDRIKTEPLVVKSELINRIKPLIKDQSEFTRHFIPNYNPLIKRMAYLPDESFFDLINSGKLSIVTDNIESFTKTGILLDSGQQINSDIIITATGFNMSIMNNIKFMVDNIPVKFADLTTYRGIMFTGLPNFTWMFGYYHGTWTLRINLISEFVGRLISHMNSNNYSKIILNKNNIDDKLLPWIDQNIFNPGYMMRNIDTMPRRSNNKDWQYDHDFWNDREFMPNIDLNSDIFRYE